MPTYLSSFILLLIINLSGCGFQLRQPLQVASAYQQIIIKTDQANLSGAQLQQALQQRKIQALLNSDKVNTKNTLIVHLSKESFSQHLAAIRNKEVKAYDTEMQLIFTAYNEKGKTLISARNLSVSQQSNYNSQQILSSAQEENIIQQDLTTLMVNKIIHKLESLSSKL